MAPHVRLAGFEPRWTAFRRGDLQQGIERAVLDTGAADEDAAGDAQRLVQARNLAGPDSALVILELSISEWSVRHRRRDSCDVAVRQVLSVALRETDQPSGVLGFVELDDNLRPTGRASRPMPLVDLGSQ
jgi:hypothetical protein